MPHLTLGGVRWDTICLQVADTAMTECMHSTWCNPKLLAERC